jgi:hypothetical protein
MADASFLGSVVSSPLAITGFDIAGEQGITEILTKHGPLGKTSNILVLIPSLSRSFPLPPRQSRFTQITASPSASMRTPAAPEVPMHGRIHAALEQADQVPT